MPPNEPKERQLLIDTLLFLYLFLLAISADVSDDHTVQSLIFLAYTKSLSAIIKTLVFQANIFPRFKFRHNPPGPFSAGVCETPIPNPRKPRYLRFPRRRLKAGELSLLIKSSPVRLIYPRLPPTIFKFHLFLALPTEIRMMIIKLATLQPRHLNLAGELFNNFPGDIAGQPKRHWGWNLTEYEPPNDPLSVTMKREPLEALPATFYVSKGVYEMAAEVWFASWPMKVGRPVPSIYDDAYQGLQRPIRYNAGLDICFVNFDSVMWHFVCWNFEDFGRNGSSFLDSLELLEIRNMDWQPRSATILIYEGPWRWCPGLRELRIIRKRARSNRNWESDMVEANKFKDELEEYFANEQMNWNRRTIPKITLVDYVEGRCVEDWGQGDSKYGWKAQNLKHSLDPILGIPLNPFGVH